MNIQTVTVIGSTGTMGVNVAGIFASFGNAKVYCVGRDLEKVKKSLPKTVKSVRADAIAARLIPADFSMLEKCVADSDLIFESAKEDLLVKSEIAMRVSSAMKDSAVSCTGTSGLSITKIAESYQERLRNRFFGVHMFNPPYSMSLCEFITTSYSDPKVANELKNYLQTVLRRTVVDVKDTPAFLANRIGFQFINEALQYAELYSDNGGVDYIDAILGPFTGRAMAPLMTSDFVGLDVHEAIVDNIYKHTEDYAHESFRLPAYVTKLIGKYKLGRKTNCGLYQQIRYDNGLVRKTVYDINTGMYRDVLPYSFPFAEKMKKHFYNGNYLLAMDRLINNRSLEAEICLSFLLRYIVYAIYCADEVGFSISAADDVMATGFNWCPPLALFYALASITNVRALIKERLPELTNTMDVDYLLSKVHPSKYDFRPYFKSGRKI